MRWLLPLVTLAMFSFHGSVLGVPPGSPCTTSLGRNINILDCSVAFRHLFSTFSLQRLDDAQMSRPQRFTFGASDKTYGLPQAAIYGNCAVGISIHKSHRPSLVTNWKNLIYTMEDLIRECVLEGEHGSGGKILENGLILVVARPEAIEVQIGG